MISLINHYQQCIYYLRSEAEQPLSITTVSPHIAKRPAAQPENSLPAEPIIFEFESDGETLPLQEVPCGSLEEVAVKRLRVAKAAWFSTNDAANPDNIIAGKRTFNIQTPIFFI
jgi:hypothetical protein